MSSDQENAPNLLEDLKNIAETLMNDKSGERSRALVAYFDQCAIDSEQKKLICEDANEKHLLGLMRDAYQASSAIVSKTWNNLHWGSNAQY